jgi:transposase-like protein
MKPTQLIAAAVTAAVLGTAGVSIAGAASDGGSAPTSTQTSTPAITGQDNRRAGPALHRARRALRHGLQLAAKTIDIEPKALARELRAGKSIADVATEHGVDPNTVITALVDAATIKINAAKTAGKLTEEQATKLLASLQERVTRFVQHKGKLGAHGKRAQRMHRRARAGGKLAAQTIGIDPKALRDELRSGKSIADVATEHGVDPNTVITALVDAATTKINAAKAAGKITDAQATKLLATVKERVSRFVQHQFGAAARAGTPDA